ncbi:anion permease [Parvularcula marina]|uniref:inorganic phosphate transporter n=1 Tax=Parvularcula marina TaxID=2292771 RepID=UPI003513A519
MELFLPALAAILLFALTFANGANDVSKAIATLAGAGVTTVQRAVLWGTIWTVAGSLFGLVWGHALIKNISSSIYVESHDFVLAVAVSVILAPALWVALATWRKWPVSTTHAVVGGLVGVGLIAYGANAIDWETLGKKIALPLLASPLMAIVLAYFLTPLLERVAHRFHADGDDDPLTEGARKPRLTVDHLHWLTSGLLSFSRGLNDTPKLIAITLPVLMLSPGEVPVWTYLWAATAMGAGSYLAGRRITKVLGFDVTKLSHAQGFAANLISTVLVLGASRLGLPVSTTHVSSSSIIGLGLVNKRGVNMKTVRAMVLAWIITLPAAALFAILSYSALAALTGSA